MIWKDSYEIGVPVIDQQHKELFLRASDFIGTLNQPGNWSSKLNKVSETLEFMKIYVIEHFKNEEMIQKEIGYPGYDRHCQIHYGMVVYIANFEKSFRQDTNQQKLVQEFAGKLMAWLINHVIATDQQIGHFIRKDRVDASFEPTLEPVLYVIQKTFKSMLNIAATPSDIVVPAKDPTHCVNVEITLTGDIQGKIIFQYPEQFALQIVQIMSGMNFESIDAFVESALSELSNIITGGIASVLSNMRISCDITPPSVVKSPEFGQEDTPVYSNYVTDIGTLTTITSFNQPLPVDQTQKTQNS